jgi:hypothetical protein
MKDSPTPRAEPQKSAPRSQGVGVYDTPEPSQGSAKKPVAVDDRPERAPGLRSPALTVVLVIAAVLALLFVLRLVL